MKRLNILFWFDVEDFINPESEEALIGLLDVLDERGVQGIFKIVGEKARTLQTHGRTDILERLKRHEIGYHTDWHSVHPVVTEELEPLGFREGADRFAERERGGFDDLKRVTGLPIRCYGQPGLSWAPQAHPALRRWNVPAYLDTHPQITMKGRPFWYGGLLHFTSLTGIMGLPLEEDGLERAKREFDRLCEAQQGEEVGFISLFYHPTEFVFEQFWDSVNFAKGRNPPRAMWKKPPFRPDGDMRKYLDRVGQFIDYTRKNAQTEYVTTGQLLEAERAEKRALTREEIRGLAGRVGADLGYWTEGRLSLSASELFWVMRQYMLGEEAAVPELVYGPEREAESGPARRMKIRDIKKALQAEMPTVCGFQQLPDVWTIAGGSRLNPVDMACTIASAIAQGLSDEDEIMPVPGTLAAARHSSKAGDWAKWWDIFPERLEVPNIVRHSALQTWTLKPALF